MKYSIALSRIVCILMLLVLSSCLQARRRSYARIKKTSPTFIRVLLDDKSTSGPLWELSNDSGFIVSDLKDTNHQQKIKASKLVIGTRGSEVITLNDKQILSDGIKIDPLKGNIRYGSNEYKGTFLVMRKDNKMHLINRLALEEYVASGLRWEMIPGWPQAALEAGAIAYRSYVAHTLLKVRNKNKKSPHKRKIYDICCTPVHQSYKGLHTCTSIHQAVKNTEGLVLAHNKEPILALYDACCGGSIPARRLAVDFKKAPYLERFYACRYCKKCTYYTWSASYTMKELSRLLYPALGIKGTLTDIKIHSTDRAGVVQELRVKVKGQWSKIQASKVPILAKNIKSCTFTITRRGTSIRFNGSGYGHQLGFCQWGARGLAERNWNCKRILRFYYPLTKFMKVA